MSWLEVCELASYLVTVIGLLFAIAVFIYEQRKERRDEEEELHQDLSDDYTDFLKLVLENADLQLLRRGGNSAIPELTPEQEERKFALFAFS